MMVNHICLGNYGITLKEIEQRKAEKRRLETLKVGDSVKVPDRDKSPERESTSEEGRTRDAIGEKIGMSGKSFERGEKIM